MNKAVLLIITLLLSGASELFAGAWTLPKGKLWTKVTYFQQSTDEWYAASRQFIAGKIINPSTRTRYNFEGQYESKAFFAEAFYGVTDRFDVGVQLPYFDQVFSDETRIDPVSGARTPVSDAGLSDMRLFAKFRLIEKPFLFTLNGGIKMPTGEFKNEDGLIPVGEGQWDFDLIAQLGRSFWPLSLYGNVDVGYRVRTKNDEIDRDPGDEWFLNAELGYNITRRLLLAGKYEALRSDPSVEFGSIVNRSQIKRISYLVPMLLYDIDGNTALEAGVRISINGRNFPAGRQFVFGLSRDFTLR